MEYKDFKDDSFLVRFERGEKIPDALLALTEEQKWKTGALSAIGAVENSLLGYFDLEQKKYLKYSIDGIAEVLSLKGNLSLLNDKPFWHLHAIVSDRNGNVRGGHLINMDVAITLECWIWTKNASILREPDDFTGLNFLKLK